MARVGQARKRDANEDAIVKALEARGVLVLRVSGKGCPDLFVCFQGRWHALEVKGKGGRLTPAQRRIAEHFTVVYSFDEAWAAILRAR